MKTLNIFISIHLSQAAVIYHRLLGIVAYLMASQYSTENYMDPVQAKFEIQKKSRMGPVPSCLCDICVGYTACRYLFEACNVSTMNACLAIYNCLVDEPWTLGS